MLRDLVPHSDQKRDKASFLLEVMTYYFVILFSYWLYVGNYYRSMSLILLNGISWLTTQFCSNSMTGRFITRESLGLFGMIIC